MTDLSLKDITEHFEDELAFLIQFCKEFDNGDIKKAKLIALELRKFLHDSTKSKSLLGQLNLKNEFLDTVLVFEKDQFDIKKSETHLAHSLIGNVIHQWKPVFDDNNNSKIIDFDQWWLAIVISDIEGNSFSRKDLVKTFADKDGGAHIDPKIDSDFYKLTKQNSTKFFTYNITGTDLPGKLDISKLKPVISPAYYTVRQIAHEVLRSLKVNYTIDSNQYHGNSFYFVGLS